MCGPAHRFWLQSACEAMCSVKSRRRFRKCFELLKKAGFVQIEYGIESGSQKVLQIMNKRATVEQNRKAITLTQKVGIRALANIIVGTPGETKLDLLETMKFLREVKPDYVAVNRFVPFPWITFFTRRSRLKISSLRIGHITGVLMSKLTIRKFLIKNSSRCSY